MAERKSLLYKCLDHPAKLNNMRLNNKWCDITIKVDGKEFRAHKTILAASLQYFETMLLNESFQESKDGVIIMESIEASDLEAFISYAYTGEILLTDNNALSLLEVANYLSEDDIKKACVEFLEENLKQEDALRAYVLAKTTGILLLKNVAKLSILSNFEVCSQSPDYLDFDFDSIKDILSDGKKQPFRSQQIFFIGIIQWIKHDIGNRKIVLKDLLNSIDMSKLSNDYMMNYLGSMVYCQDGNGVIEDIIFCHHSSKLEEKKQEHMLFIIGSDYYKKILYQFYSFTEKKWSTLQEIEGIIGEVRSNAVVLNNKLYYISSDEHRLQEFNFATKQNITVNVSNMILADAALCACSKFLYLCGGWKSSDSAIGQVLKYDPLMDTFETLPPIGIERWWGAAAVFYQGYLHVLGGYDDESDLPQNLVKKYDPDTKKWIALPSMYEENYHHTLAVVDGKLYTSGGDHTDIIQVYDPLQKSWTIAKNMNVNRSIFMVVAHNGKLLAVGGDKEKTVEVYDPSTDQWQINHAMSSGLQIQYPKGGLISASYIDNAE